MPVDGQRLLFIFTIFSPDSYRWSRYTGLRMNKRRISIWLIVITIGVIVAFQVSWLRKNYTDEKRVFTIHADNLFQETVFHLQTAKLHLDTTINLKTRGKAAFVQMTNMLTKVLINDSGAHGPLEERLRLEGRPPTAEKVNKVVITMHNGKSDTMPTVYYRTANAKIIEFLAGVDSLQGHITEKDIADRYREALVRENVHLPFRISRVPGGIKADVHFPEVVPDSNRTFQQVRMLPDHRGQNDFFIDSLNNRVTIGFRNPVTYQLDFDNLFWFLIRRISGQLVFSFVLVGLTVLSMGWLYRNWQQQRRLIALKNDFIGNMTHELKTPIATVSVAVEALQHFNALEDPVKTKEYLDISAGELQRLSLLVDKVLKLSLFEREEIRLKNDHFDLKTLVEEVTESMRLQFEKLRARLYLGTEGSDFSLRADKLHITSVIFNLLDNALKYSKTAPSIRVDVVAEPKQLVLSVSDNGIGIPAVYREKIFEKFFRVPTGDHHDVKGYGLGLSYVSYVLQRQGGGISVESQEGAGSRFIVRIPRNQSPFTQPPSHV